LVGDLAIAQAAGNQGEDFEFARRDAEVLLLGRVGSEGDRVGNEGGRSLGGHKHFLHHHRFPDDLIGCLAPARDAQPEPDAEGREKDGDQRTVNLDGVFDDDEAVFGVLEGDGKEVVSPAENRKADA
jgi:hypothetical protein